MAPGIQLLPHTYQGIQYRVADHRDLLKEQKIVIGETQCFA